jgi:hypothetical protein
MFCAKTNEAAKTKPAAIIIFMTDFENELGLLFGWREEFIRASKVSGQF